MFGFVGQSSKMDNSDIYDSYIKVMPPLKRSAEVLVKALQFFRWSHVAMIGGGLDTNTWDKVDALWKTVETQLRSSFTLTAEVKFDTSNPQLIHQNVKYISEVARGKHSAANYGSSTKFLLLIYYKCCVTLSPSSNCGADKQRRLCGSAAGGRASGSDEW